jgi:hypothetical protein
LLIGPDKSLTVSFKEAQKTIELWGNEFKASQYSAWILNDGNHRTKGKGAHNWNAELSKPLRLDLDRPSHHLVKEIESVLDDLQGQAVAVFKGLHECAKCEFISLTLHVKLDHLTKI